jgi:hypothetical protein
MSAAQVQLAWIFSWRLRAPRVIRAVMCRILYLLGLGAGKRAHAPSGTIWGLID